MSTTTAQRRHTYLDQRPTAVTVFVAIFGILLGIAGLFGLALLGQAGGLLPGWVPLVFLAIVGLQAVLLVGIWKMRRLAYDVWVGLAALGLVGNLVSGEMGALIGGGIVLAVVAGTVGRYRPRMT